MSKIDFPSVLACLALLIMGAIAGALIFHAVPADNQQLVTFALGAIAGALTVGGGKAATDRLTSASGNKPPPADIPPAGE